MKMLLICFLSLSFSSVGFAQSLERRCIENVRTLGDDLIIILRKNRVMPAYGKLYVELRSLFDKAASARDRQNYSLCVELANEGLKYSARHAGR